MSTSSSSGSDGDLAWYDVQDVISVVFEWLAPAEVLHARQTCVSWMNAAVSTLLACIGRNAERFQFKSRHWVTIDAGGTERALAAVSWRELRQLMVVCRMRVLRLRDDTAHGSLVPLAAVAPFPALVEARLGGAVSDATLVPFVSRCPNLTTLDLSWVATNVSDSALAAVAHLCPGLRVLRVGNTGELITDRSLALLCGVCTGLTEIDMRGQVRARGAGTVDALAQHCEQLESFACTAYYNNLCDGNIASLAMRCSSLTSFSIVCIRSNMSDEAMIAVASHCPRLKFVDVSWTEGCIVSNRSLQAMAVHCPALTHLDLSQSAGRGRTSCDEGLAAVIRQCPDLAFLDLQGTDGQLTRQALLEHAATNNGLRLLRAGRRFLDGAMDQLQSAFPNATIESR